MNARDTWQQLERLDRWLTLHLQERARQARLAQLARWGQGDHAPVEHQRNPVGVLGFVDVVGGQEDGHPAARQTIDQCPKAAARYRIDTGGWLVEEQQWRLVHDRATKRQAL